MKVAVFVAHADDETLGAGGTIQRFLQQGADVSVVIFSDGIISTRGTVQDNRNDAFTACEILGVAPPIFLDFPDQKFDTIAMAELSGRVAQLDLQPDLIITHFDGDLNRDHRLVAEAAKVIGRPRHKPVSILGCEIPNTTFWNGTPFPANFYVDISSEIDTKISAFAAYTNECHPYPSPLSKHGLQLLARYHGMQCGLELAEAFHIVRGYDFMMLKR